MMLINYSPMTTRPMLSETERRALAAELNDMVAEAGSQSAAERRYGIRQQTINVGLRGNIGPVVKEAILAARGTTMLELLAKHGVLIEVGSPQPPRWSELPGWDAAASEAIKQWGYLEMYIRAAGQMPADGTPPSPITPAFVKLVARYTKAKMPEADKKRLEREVASSRIRRDSKTFPVGGR